MGLHSHVLSHGFALPLHSFTHSLIHLFLHSVFTDKDSCAPSPVLPTQDTTAEQTHKTLCIVTGQTINKVKPVELIAFPMVTLAKERSKAERGIGGGGGSCYFRGNI